MKKVRLWVESILCWQCPDCGTTNEIDIHTDTVTCDKCDKEFETLSMVEPGEYI